MAVIFPSFVQAEYRDFIEVQMSDHLVEIKTPPWSYAGFHHLHTEEFYASANTQNGGEFHLTEFIPKGETFGQQGEMYGGWSRLYAIALETGVQRSAEEAMIGQLSIYYSACEELDWQRTSPPTPSVEAFIVICTAFKDKPDTGEISFFYLSVEDKTMLKNYYHIRTPRIDIANFPSGERGDVATDALNDIFKMLFLYKPPVLR